MIQTNAQYMSEQARVERVVKKLMGVTVGELEGKAQGRRRDWVSFTLDQIVDNEGLSAEKARKMTYAEYACLIDHMGKSEKYNWYDHDCKAERLVSCKLLGWLLLEASKTSVPVRLFLALPLKAFYDYLRNVKRTCQEDIRCEFESIKRGCGYSDSYTIKDFLWEKDKEVTKAWMPILPLEGYTAGIREAHDDIGRVLVDSFAIAFPEQFDVKRICRKYAEGDDGWKAYKYDEETSEWLPF